MRKKTIIILLFFYLSLILRLAVFFFDPVMTRDSCLYTHAADIIYQEKGFDSLGTSMPDLVIPPLFLSMIVWLKHCGLTSGTAAVFINVISGSFVPFIAAGIAYTIFRKKSMFWATLVLATFHPLLIELSGYGQRDMIYLLLAGALLWLLSSALNKQDYALWIGTGILFPLACLIRYESLEFLPIILFFLIASRYLQKTTWKTTVLNMLFFCFFSIMVVFTYLQLTGTDRYIHNTYANYCNKKITSVAHYYN